LNLQDLRKAVRDVQFDPDMSARSLRNTRLELSDLFQEVKFLLISTKRTYSRHDRRLTQLKKTAILNVPKTAGATVADREALALVAIEGFTPDGEEIPLWLQHEAAEEEMREVVELVEIIKDKIDMMITFVATFKTEDRVIPEPVF
jgi:hypothetical protein